MMGVPCVTSFESIVFKVSGVSPFLILFIYHPPKHKPLLFDELTELLVSVNSLCASRILIGDINIYVNNRNCNHTVNFIETVDCFNLIQHINFTNHSKGHKLDLV